MRTLIPGSAALALFSFMALSPGEAQARGGWRVHVEARPVVVVRPSYAPPPPPPPVVRYYPPAVVYRPAPVVYVPPPAPAPVVVHHNPAPAVRPALGLSVSGLAQESSGSYSAATGGMSLAAQLRTSSHSLTFIELQFLAGPRTDDGRRRADLAGLLGLRLFLWDAPLTPYLEMAGGLGESTHYCCGYEAQSGQLVGRYGVGLELRLGRNLALEGQVGQMHRFTIDSEDRVEAPLGEHRRSMEVRAGVTFRF